MKKEKKKKGPVAKVLTVVAIIIAVIMVISLSYIAYVFISYSRIEDYQVLDVSGKGASPTIEIGKELTVTSYNIGFGAYSEDYTFFMDGGKESWAFSKEDVYENIDGAMGVITQIKPDIALFQEIDFDATRSYHVDERILVEDAMGEAGSYSNTFAQNYDSPFLMYPILQPHGRNKAGIMTFSTADITAGLRRSLPIETGLSKVLDLDRCYSKSRVHDYSGYAG